MSGQASGWVLRHGPKPEHIDRTGKRYGTRARGYRLVLLTVADAANRDGEHAHPGNASIVDGSLYAKSQALAIVAELIAEGWLEVTEQGNGRGNATVYRVVMAARETVRPSDSSPKPNGPATPAKQSDAEAETVRSGPGAPLSPTEVPNEVPNAPTAPPPRAPLSERDPLMARAIEVTKAHWDECHANGTPTPTLKLDGAANPFIAVAKVVRGQLEVGWSDEQLATALRETAAFTTNAITVALRRKHRQGPTVHRGEGPPREAWGESGVVHL